MIEYFKLTTEMVHICERSHYCKDYIKAKKGGLLIDFATKLVR